MQSLRHSIEGLSRRVAGDSKCFVPRYRLLKLLSRETIRNALETCEAIPAERVESIADQIFKNARRTFAILVVLEGEHAGEILHFVQHDNFQSSPIDHRLPFDKAELARIIPNCSEGFYNKQWEFSAPVFLKNIEHRSLNESTILPFLVDEKLGAGGFGQVFSITLHKEHQDPSWLSNSKVSLWLSRVKPQLISVQTTELVRKQFDEKVQKGSAQSHGQEYHNFTLLAHLQHPNIQQLFSSYTFDHKHNFIFPRATDGDMEALFAAQDRPLELKEDVSYYIALARLCSAVEAMHSFTVSERLDVHVMGLHRDIKPSNILVSGSDFILTDFGLSTFKSIVDLSETQFKIGGGDCLPPECQDLHTFRKGVVGCSGDIWALGCVMLELLVYMMEGPRGVLIFREKRAVSATFIKRTFHGPGKEVSPYVLELMHRLYGSCRLRGKQLIELIRSMLKIEPKSRPLAPEVTMKACYLAISGLKDLLIDSYTAMLASTNSIQGAVEYWKLESWYHVSMKEGTGLCSVEQVVVPRFSEIIQILQTSRVEVERISAVHESTGRALFHDLRRMNETLINMLPEEAQRRSVTYFDMKCLGDEAFSSTEAFESTDTDNSSVLHRLGTLAYARKFSKDISTAYESVLSKMTEASLSGLRLDAAAVEVEQSPNSQEHNLGWVSSGNETRKRVLIEWIKYDLHWEGEVQEEMIGRVVSIATSLHTMATKAEKLRLLPCIHYYHHETEKSFGLIYQLSNHAQPATPLTLHSLIEESRQTGTYSQISLEDRFILAHTLTTTLLNFHKATLVHKSISSHNIIFTSTLSPDLYEPYLIGFNYARPVEPDAFTTGPPRSKEAKKYYHPDYDAGSLRDAVPFRMIYDYYSLGLVLLEIGLWDTVDGIKSKSSRDLKSKILEKRVPQLNHLMGSAYRDAVAACLQGGIAQDSPETYEDTILDFQRLVVEAIVRPIFSAEGVHAVLSPDEDEGDLWKEAADLTIVPRTLQGFSR